MSLDYCLQVIRVENLQWKSRLHSQVPDLYVEVGLKDDVKRTRTIRKSKTPVWNERLIFSSSNGPKTFSVQVKHDSSWSLDVCVGYVDIKFSDLLTKCATGEASVSLLSPSEKVSAKPVGSIALHLEVVDQTTSASMMIQKAGQDVQGRGFTRWLGAAGVGNSINDAASQLSDGSELYQAIGQLLSRLGAFKEVIDVVSGIHPFLTVAWTITSGLLQAVSNVFKTDQKIIQLVRSMEDAFSFVRDVESLAESARNLQEPIVGLLKQIIECSLFIRQYTSQGFVGRMLDVSGGEKVDEFEQSLAEFKKKIESGTIIHTAIVSLRISEGIDALLLRQLLNPSVTDAFDRPVCLTGTRVEIQSRIIEWMFSDTKQNIFWLHGAAGSGKSTVSTTIAEHLRDMSRLSAYLFFERGRSEPSSVVRTLAYKLALFDSSIGSSILSEIEHDKDIVAASSVNQFNKLLLRPLVTAARSMSGPVMIVLDALDECGTPESRRSLLQLFRREFPKLPSNFRILITSRPEPDIAKVLSSQPDSTCETELDYTSTTSQNDVLAYLRSAMYDAVSEQVDIPENWPWDRNISLLAKSAGGLFIWASTAVKMVSTSDNPFLSLRELVSDSGSVSHFGLEELYGTVLRSSGIVWTKDSSRTRFTSVLALVLLSKDPISSKAIDGVLGLPPEETSLLVLSRLRCLLNYSPGGPVSLFHASFADYLVSPERAGDPWCIDITAQQQFIATRCFFIMDEMLHYNMCKLETSFVRNDDIPDLEDRIKGRIQPHLEYACLHWSQHLYDVPYSHDLLAKLSDFAFRLLLYWFEVLSFVKEFRRRASSVLVDASTWVGIQDASVSSFLRDAGKLASIFALPISESTSHIYVSMIPLTKADSEASAHYSKRMSSMVRIEQKGVKGTPMFLKVFEGHSDAIWSIAFSPNGAHIFTASQDRTIRTWDFESGEGAVASLSDDSGYVWPNSFSPDGTLIVTGSWDGSLRIWDVQTGDLVRGPLKKHTSDVFSVAFSLDGKRFASGSLDETVIVWELETGETIAGPLAGHTAAISAVALSSDGMRVASGSWDFTVRIWNVADGTPVVGPLGGNQDRIMSVTFSPDDKCVVSGCRDGTIKIWEVENGNVVYGSSCKHTAPINSVAYSPCGTYVASGSWDRTIIIWDARSGQIVSGPLEGHTDGIYSVAFSPDGEYVASVSRDRTVRIWDTTIRNADTGTLAKHAGDVGSVTFSSDGRRLASASDDRTIIIWDSRTGEAIRSLKGHSAPVYCVTFLSDDSLLVSGSGDRTLRIWDVDSGRSVFGPLEGHSMAVLCVNVSPDGLQIASGSRDRTIRVWDTRSGRLVTGPLQAVSDVYSIAFSPDGKHLASAHSDKLIRIWDTRTWKAAREPLSGHENTIYSVAFSLDGTRIVSGGLDCTVVVWDWKEGQMLGNVLRQNGAVCSAIFSLDGRHLISGSGDTAIRIWDLDSGELLCEPLGGHTSDVLSLALSPDGSQVASSSTDSTIRIWDLSSILRQSESPSDDASVSASAEERWTNWVLGENGWVRGRQDRGDLLLWIPPELRRTLLRPQNMAVFSCEFSTRLDFTGAALGERWIECYSP